MVLRLGRYTFDGNALPRPQLSRRVGAQLIGIRSCRAYRSVGGR